jgi:predicted transcriptional regulator
MLTINLGGVLLEESKPNITDVALKELNLLGRHLDVFKVVKDKGPIGIIRLSKMTGQPQHMIRYSLRTLEKNGFIRPSPNGAVVTENIHESLNTLESTLEHIDDTITLLKNKLKDL